MTRTCALRQGIVYEIEEFPRDGLDRTELAIKAPGTHHIVADQLDLVKQGSGAHHMEYASPVAELGMDIDVEALEGSGDYHLEANIIGACSIRQRMLPAPLEGCGAPSVAICRQ